MKQSEKKTKKAKSHWGLFRGEWILILAILIVSGTASFFFVRNQLQVADVDEVQQQNPSDVTPETWER